MGPTVPMAGSESSFTGGECPPKVGGECTRNSDPLVRVYLGPRVPTTYELRIEITMIRLCSEHKHCYVYRLWRNERKESMKLNSLW